MEYVRACQNVNRRSRVKHKKKTSDIYFSIRVGMWAWLDDFPVWGIADPQTFFGPSEPDTSTRRIKRSYRPPAKVFCCSRRNRSKRHSFPWKIFHRSTMWSTLVNFSPDQQSDQPRIFVLEEVGNVDEILWGHRQENLSTDYRLSKCAEPTSSKVRVTKEDVTFESYTEARNMRWMTRRTPMNECNQINNIFQEVEDDAIH